MHGLGVSQSHEHEKGFKNPQNLNNFDSFWECVGLRYTQAVALAFWYWPLYWLLSFWEFIKVRWVEKRAFGKWDAHMARAEQCTSRKRMLWFVHRPTGTSRISIFKGRSVSRFKIHMTSDHSFCFCIQVFKLSCCKRKWRFPLRDYGWPSDVVAEMKDTSSNHGKYRMPMPYHQVSSCPHPSFASHSGSVDTSMRRKTWPGGQVWSIGVLGWKLFKGTMLISYQCWKSRLAQISWNLLDFFGGLIFVANSFQWW